MSQQLDYEATKAALRAQVYGTAGVHRHLITRAWKWYGVATSVVVIGCAVVLTLWVTTGTSVSMVPSGERAGTTIAHSNGSTASALGLPPIPGTPVRQVLLQPDGTVVRDAAGVPVVVTTPEAAEAAVARGFLLRPASTPEELAAPVTPLTVIAATPRPKPPAPSNGGGTRQPTQPPVTGGSTGTPPVSGGTTEPTTPPPAGPTTDPNPPASSGPTDPPATSPVDPPPATDPAPAPAPDPTTDAVAAVAADPTPS